MRTLIITLITFIFPVALISQTSFSKDVNSAEKETYLTATEKQVVYYINLVRSNPALFEKTILKKYLDSTGMNNNYTKSLIKTLKETKPMDVLQPSKELFDVAKLHAIKFGKAGKIGHDNFAERTKSLKPIFGSMVAENCDYGSERALDIVMSLLIDEGIPDFGHRKNILDPNYKFIGVSIQPHKKHGVNCVMDFGGEKLK